ncbi:MAG: hypothetical protein ABIJ09_21670 [Pseudomonadota bacterium]
MRAMLVLGLATAVLTWTACAPVVHAGCDSDADCESRCETGRGAFPGGLCTRTCNKTEDCPADAHCIDIEGGLCLIACSSMDQCRDFGSGYLCKDKKDVHGQPQLVCLGD